MTGHDTRGMVRKDDHATSIAAAETVNPATLRARVLHFADACGRDGFTDSYLRGLDRNRPESSMRKRRTELAQENWLIDTGRTRENEHGQQEIVWVHRDHCVSPPPLKQREPQISKDEQINRLKAREAELIALLRQAHPFVGVKPVVSDLAEVGIVKRRIRKAIDQ